MTLKEMTDYELSQVVGQAGIDLLGALNVGLNQGSTIEFPTGITYNDLYSMVSEHLQQLNTFDPKAMFTMYENMISIILAGGLTKMTDIEIGPILEMIINNHKDLLVNYLKDSGIGTLTFHNYSISASGKINISIH